MSTRPTVSTRRSFLARSLAALAAVPLLARAASAAKSAAQPEPQRWVSYPPGQRGILVQGRAIKVPSNRVTVLDRGLVMRDGMRDTSFVHFYAGEWDGTFKLESGCTNPAYILADLTERAGGPDWVLEPRRGQLFSTDGKTLLNWQMIYDWGRACDEPAICGGAKEMIRKDDGSITQWSKWGPSFSVQMQATTPEGLEATRQVLRMHCLRWQSTDPRYRTSWPGIPYPSGTEGAA